MLKIGNTVFLYRSGIQLRLMEAVLEAGSQKALAKKAGCSQAFLNDVLKSRREPTGPLLAYLGYQRETIYRPLADRERG